MKVLALIAVTLAVASAAVPKNSMHQLSIKERFDIFQKEHARTYRSASEKKERFEIFKQNVKKIDEHNAGKHSWFMEINQFADMSEEEFRSTRLGYVNIKKDDAPFKAKEKNIDISELPTSVDWREKGAISAVKDQGSCGSCWAFATTENIESYWQINEGGEVPELSAQEITSCTPNTLTCGGTGGCQGSIPQLGYTYANSFGVVLDADMPYTSGDTGSTGECKWDASTMTQAAILRGYEVLPRNNITIVMEHLANKGPLAVAADASPWGFYGGGVYDGCPYTSNINLNHAIQLVGYGTDDSSGEDYWLVRNSWGAFWGESGYIRMKRESTLECGFDDTPLSGVACVNDGQDQQYVCGMCGLLFDVSYPIGVSKPTA